MGRMFPCQGKGRRNIGAPAPEDQKRWVGRNVPGKAVAEEPAVNTGLLDRMRWEDSPMPYFLLNFRQIGSLFRFFDFCSILLHNAYRRRLNP